MIGDSNVVENGDDDHEELKKVVDGLKQTIAPAPQEHEAKLVPHRKIQRLADVKASLSGTESEFVEESASSSSSGQEDDLSIRVLAAMHKRLTIERDAIKMSSEEHLSKAAEEKPDAEYHFKSSVDALTELTKDLKSRKEDLTSTLQSLDESIERDEMIAKVLRARVRDARKNVAKQRAETEDEEIARLKEKIRNVRIQTKKISEQMAQFLDRYFPSPDLDMDESDASWFLGERPDSSRPCMSMLEMIEKVINKYIETPDDCYLEVDDTWWQPHLDMLLQCGVVVAHPQSASRVRLEHYGQPAVVESDGYRPWDHDDTQADKD